MNQITSNLVTLLQNPHFRYPAIIVLLCEGGKIWFPQYAGQFDATQKPFVIYLVAAAANSTPTVGQAQPPTQQK
jgi:hypothetical protein